MKIKHDDILFDKENPFKNCKLDREQYAQVLTGLVENYSSGFVLAINNKWGTGKTTFVKMWNQYLLNKEYKTIYFNAWENDFEDNPLTALVGELKEVNKGDKDKFNKVLKNAALITKNLVPALAKSLANKYLDSETLIEGISESTKSLTEIFEKEVNEYAERKNSIREFRENLSNFVTNESDGKPLIFIIDELDRCRPNYSVSLLEQVKHFFSVPNIVFILSIDKEQLGNAICG
ncbi:P-loop NTPase fold protein, partial [Flavobacterium sp.]|uniref:KAP family P-loop NTPase fold protein n=1 Tax=Flavobacterium sp. TaxID=239 RepID=UPI0038FC0ACE